MSTIHLHQTMTTTPEEFLAGLTDFGKGRSELFGNSADEYLRVHRRGTSDADVTEGSGGVWERLHYDWSDPMRVVMTTTDSNVWGGASSHTYTFTRRPDGTTDLDAVVVREGKNLKGRALGLLLGVFGERVLGGTLAKTVKAIEARNRATTSAARPQPLPVRRETAPESPVADDHRRDGGHDRNRAWIRVVMHYSIWGELAFSFAFTPLPTSIDYVCGLCGELVGRVTDHETLQRFRYHEPRLGER